MANECCQLVGNLNLGIDGCIISVSSNCSTEIGVVCGSDPIEGPSTQTVSISAYGSTSIWTGCPAKAGVSISYVRKYDCVNDIVYLIFAGQGQSFISGNISTVSLNSALATSCTSYSASSSSGPATIYMEATQTNGYGLSYTGDPISFDTANMDTTFSLGNLGNDFYLQSFNFDAQPGQFPVVSYTFVKPL